MFNVLAGKFIALVTSSVALLLRAGPDLALSAMHKKFIRQAATALNIFYGKLFTIGEVAFVKIHQPFLEFMIIFTVCNIDGTDSAIKTTRRNKIGIYRHISILQFIIA
jgi:hypothetical protein